MISKILKIALAGYLASYLVSCSATKTAEDTEIADPVSIENMSGQCVVSGKQVLKLKNPKLIEVYEYDLYSWDEAAKSFVHAEKDHKTTTNVVRNLIGNGFAQIADCGE